MNLNIAIDGPVASGKGTVARGVAKKLGIRYLDTGSLYRAIALFLDDKGMKCEDVVVGDLKGVCLDFCSENHVLLNGVDVEDKIRSPYVSSIVFLFAKNKVVRDFVTKVAKEIVKNQGFVVDGRDAGSVIVPSAQVKIYLSAPVAVRTQRRMRDYEKEGKKVKLGDVAESIRMRDYDDMNRKVGPLVKLPEAHLIDNSDLSVERQVEIICCLARKSIDEKHI